jgi:hypothetical protein
VRTLGTVPPEAGVADVTGEELRAVLRHDTDAALRAIADVLQSRGHTYELNWEHPSVYDQGTSSVDWTTWTKQDYEDHRSAYRQALADYNTAKAEFVDKVQEFVTEYPPPPDQAAEYADELATLQAARARLRAAMLAFYRYQAIYLERGERALRHRGRAFSSRKRQQMQAQELPQDRWLLTRPNPEDPGSVLHDWAQAQAGAGAGAGTGETALEAAVEGLGDPDDPYNPDAYEVVAGRRFAPRARTESYAEGDASDAETTNSFAPRAGTESYAENSAERVRSRINSYDEPPQRAEPRVRSRSNSYDARSPAEE